MPRQVVGKSVRRYEKAGRRVKETERTPPASKKFGDLIERNLSAYMTKQLPLPPLPATALKRKRGAR